MVMGDALEATSVWWWVSLEIKQKRSVAMLAHLQQDHIATEADEPTVLPSSRLREATEADGKRFALYFQIENRYQEIQNAGREPSKVPR